MANQSIKCPNCGSSDLTDVAWNRRLCNHCGTESVVSEDGTRLESTTWQCTKCGHPNEGKTTYCGKCGAVLVKLCPKCLSEIRIDLDFCSTCGSNYASERQALFNRVELALERGLTPQPELSYINKMLKLAPEDVEGLVARGQISLLERKWRKAYADWEKAYRANPNDVGLREALDRFVSHHLSLLKEPGLVDGRLRDDRTKRYLEVIRDDSAVRPPAPLTVSQFRPPRAPGKISMGLLRGVWPAKARRMVEIYETRLQESNRKYTEQREAKEGAYQARLKKHQAETTNRERERREAMGDRLTLAAMCVAALIEIDERKRIAEEKAAREKALLEEREAKRSAKEEKGKQPVEHAGGQTETAREVPTRQMDETGTVALSSWKEAESRKELLNQQVQQAVARGARIESQSDYMAVVVSGKKVHHVLHFVLGIFTLGIWWIVWFLLIIAGGEKRKMITVDEKGRVETKKV